MILVKVVMVLMVNMVVMVMKHIFFLPEIEFKGQIELLELSMHRDDEI